MIRGVLGGSFDPVHNGHVAMASYVLEHGLAQVVHVIPARVSPHKTGTSASAEQRLAMVRLAFAGLAGVAIDDRELQRAGPSYTIDTLTELSRRYPADQLLLIIGQDNLAGLADWKDPAGIGALAEVAVLARRPDHEPGSTPSRHTPSSLQLTFHEDFDQPVSSRAIRAILAGNQPEAEELTRYLPLAVVDYITDNRLYRK